MTSNNRDLNVTDVTKDIITLSDNVNDAIMEDILRETLAQRSVMKEHEPHNTYETESNDGKELEIELSIGITQMNNTGNLHRTNTTTQISTDNDDNSNTNVSGYTTVNPDLSIADIDLDGILNAIPDFNENKVDITPSIINQKVSTYPDVDTDTIESLEIQKRILSQKVEFQRLIISDYTTKFKEYKLQLQYQYNKNEEYYVNAIETLQYQNKNQKRKLRTLQKQLQLNNELNVNHSEREGIGCNQRFHKLEREVKRLSEKLKASDDVQQKNRDLLATNTEHEDIIQQQSSHIELLEQMCALTQSMKYMTVEPSTIRRISKKTSAGISNSHTRDKLGYTISKNALDSSVDSPKLFERTNRMWRTYSLLTARITERTEQSYDEEVGPQEYVTQKNKLVIKQQPYSAQTHICINISAEIVESCDINNNRKFAVIIYFDRRYNVKELKELLQTSNRMKEMLDNNDVYIYCADDDGELGDDENALDNDQIIGELGIINFYVRIVINKNKHDDDMLPVGTMCSDHCVIV